MRAIIDESVSPTVGTLLQSRGWDAWLSTDILTQGASDPQVAAVAHEREALVVTLNHKDFVKLIARRPTEAPARYRNAGRVSFWGCEDAIISRRFKDAVALIEHEWTLAQARPDKRVIVEICPEHIRFMR